MEKRQGTKEAKKMDRNSIELDESSQYYGLTKQEIEWRKKMAAKFGRKPTHLDPNTIEESKEIKNSLTANFHNRKSGQ